MFLRARALNRDMSVSQTSWRNDVNTVVMFFSVRTKKLPFRLLQVRWLEAAGFAGFGIHAPTMVKPKRGGSAL